jgi:hypothetical protein
MKVTTQIYLVIDGQNQKHFASCGESGDTIQIVAKDNNGKLQYFESDAYHLATWCKDNNFQYKEITMTYDFDKLMKDY